jgi:DNA-directed RNA polymerase subunit RPC12/RpoP
MAQFIEATQAVSDELACVGCGAILKFKPGTLHLSCEYCGSKNEIAPPEVAGKVEELSLGDYLQNNFEQEEKFTATAVKCEACGATSTMDASISSDKCPFCSSVLVVKSGSVAKLHKPHYVLPFRLDNTQANQSFGKWLKKQWFAPNDLKHYVNSAEKLNGMYLPFWTFDCKTDSTYSGQRGQHYTKTERYTAHENGKSVTKTREVRHTRWTPASGRVSNAFDDLLIEATGSLNKKMLRALEPWDLENLMPYDDKYLSGFRTETYATDVRTAYDDAKERMSITINNAIRQDIGGDAQRINFVNTTYDNPTFKHVLLPVWISAFRYKDKVYQFLVNARTGEVIGARPFSTVKIALAVIAAIVVGVVIWWFGKENGGSH